MKKSNILNVLLFTVGLQLLALNAQLPTLHAQHVWTFDECVQYAIDHNIDIQQKAIDIQLQENKLNTTQNDWMPSLNLTAAQRFSFGNAYASTGAMPSSAEKYSADLSYTNATIDLQMPVFDGFRRKNQAQADHWSVQQATANLAQAHKSLTIQIATYYLQALYEKGMTEVAEAQVETSRQLCEKTKTLVDDGRNPKSDLADAEAQLAADEYQLTEASGRYKIALLTLSQLLNLETVEGFQITDFTDSESLVRSATLGYASLAKNSQLSALDDVIERYPSIQAGKALVEKSRYDIKTARSEYYPKLDFRASLNTYYLNFFHQSHPNGFASQMWNNKSEVVGLHLTVPIFNHFGTRNNIRKAKMTFAKSQLALDESRQQLRKEIDQAYYNAQNAQSKYLSAQKSQQASQISCTFEKDKYEAGRSTIYDLTQANQRLRKSREDLIQAKYEYIIRQKILEVYLSE